MNVPETQRVAIYQNDKPVGIIESKLDKPEMLGGRIVTMSWHGAFLGNEIHTGSVAEAFHEAQRIAAEKGLRRITVRDGSEVTTIYTPAFEE